MATDDVLLGCSGLLRVAGLPVRFWLAGANPALFEEFQRLDHEERDRLPRARELAERIGDQLVPNPSLSRDDRASLLNLRRALHRGELIGDIVPERLNALRGLSAAGADVLRSLIVMANRDRKLAEWSAQAETNLTHEQDRLLLLLDEIYQESPVAKALLSPRDEEAPALGPRFARKSRRRRTEHEWRRIARAATGSTPRDWLGHVALIPVEDGDTVVPPTVTDQFTAQWTENVRARRASLATPPDDWPAPDSHIDMNPLHWDKDDNLVFVVVAENQVQTQVSVRHTPLLDAISLALANGSHNFGELADALDYARQNERLALGGFVRHLVGLGILQPGAPPVVRMEQRAVPGQTFARVTAVDNDNDGWVDVYRYVETGISADAVRSMQRGLTQAWRVLSLMSERAAPCLTWADSTRDTSWSLSEILRADLDTDRGPTPHSQEMVTAEQGTFPLPPTRGLANLVNEIAVRAQSESEIVLEPRLLGECGAASDVLIWPVDSLVQMPAPGAGYTAVLDALWPPGMLDARFIDSLATLHGPIPHVEAYRRFLRCLEQLTGFLFVELLLPPLSDGAANAVRRPVYTRAWTGDPYAATYVGGSADPGRYIPLEAIQIHRVNGRLRAQVDEQPIWPVYHATRSYSSPWDRLARVLLAAAPLDLPWDFKSMIRILTQLPGVSATPRISVCGGIVLSPARWRVSPDDLWDRTMTSTAKLRALIRLRSRYSLPRWVYIDRGDTATPVPCDLESLHAIHTIERCAPEGMTLTLIEMLPTPDQLIVKDGGHGGDRLAAQLHLRYPCDESPEAMASRIASLIVAPLDSPGRTATGCRGPPLSGNRHIGEPLSGKVKVGNYE